jgi:hypothetical protein
LVKYVKESVVSAVKLCIKKKKKKNPFGVKKIQGIGRKVER